jgi:predicted nuclease of predicted toxin-antitoxin system
VRFLANENIPGPVVRQLRDLGYDVLWAREMAPGTADAVILARAQEEGRVLLTCDLHFGELAFRAGLPAMSGVVLIRLTWTNPDADNDRVVRAVTGRGDWSGHFAVIEDDRIRIRPLAETDTRG